MTTIQPVFTTRTGNRALRTPFRTALREITHLHWVEVTASAAGVAGTAVAAPVPRVTGETLQSVIGAVEGPLAEALREVDVSSAPAALAVMRRTIPHNTAAKAAVDAALRGLVSQRTGAHDHRSPVSACTDVTVSIGNPDVMAAQAGEHIAAGFRVLKLKVGGTVVEDLARIRAIHNLVTSMKDVSGVIQIRLDANQAWTVRETLSITDSLATAGISVQLVEQPVVASNLRGLRFITERSDIPIMADEAVHSVQDLLRLLDTPGGPAADAINIKLAKCGGLEPAQQLAGLAGEANLGVMIGCMLEPAEALRPAAALAACQSTPMFGAHDLDAAWWLQPTANDPAVYQDSAIHFR